MSKLVSQQLSMVRSMGFRIYKDSTRPGYNMQVSKTETKFFKTANAALNYAFKLNEERG